MSSVCFLGGTGHSVSCSMYWLQYCGDELWEHELKRGQKEGLFENKNSQKVEEVAKRCYVVSNTRRFQGLTLE